MRTAFELEALLYGALHPHQPRPGPHRRRPQRAFLRARRQPPNPLHRRRQPTRAGIARLTRKPPTNP
jgi:hypothetical protein